ncbi:beta-N-acetylhexosaminidase [Halosquirtibacter laminarini]|uniref:Beta-N-acetylhexosaminidase n=1 Tax=Halosquirtibacter laminarini TaxID=3374600 RepID=A0AC61NKU0_9BACT|nr:beta-N-acetylhexosaminidase [Prolixibacteraceae bacterium]
MRKLFLFLFLCIITLSLQATDIIPEPMVSNKIDGKFTFHSGIKIAAPNEFKKEALILSTLMKTSNGFEFEVKKRARHADVVLKHNPKLLDSLGEEGYKLVIRPNQITISAPTSTGAFYAIQTIRQLLPVAVDGYYPTPEIKMSIPCYEIEDQPRFSWRGYMLDCSRYFVSVDRIKKHLDLMALYKLNTFQWHLTDYQGWRMQVLHYPKLTKVGSKRDHTIFKRRGAVFVDDKTPDNGFYTQEQIKELVSYAADRHITIIPEIDLPAHSIAAIAAYPEISCTGNPAEVRALKVGGMSNVICPGKEISFEFVENVLKEVFELFPSKIVHIGGDEVKKDGWKQCPHCSKRMKEESLKDYNALQSYFITRVEAFANKHNRTIIGWDEILDGGVAPNAMVMSWRGEKGGIKAAKMHHPVVMTPNSFLYFDYLQSNDKHNEPYVQFRKVLPIKEVYRYNPTPSSLSEKEQKYIMGAQANMWGNFVTTPAHYEYMTYPRLCALSELVWTPLEKKNYNHFESKLEKQYQRFDEMHVAYRRHDKSVQE